MFSIAFNLFDYCKKQLMKNLVLNFLIFKPKKMFCYYNPKKNFGSKMSNVCFQTYKKTTSLNVLIKSNLPPEIMLLKVL